MRLHMRPLDITQILFLCLFVSPSLVSAATSFCKCTCFSNSTIIALNPPDQASTSSPNPRPLVLRRDKDEKQHRAGNCNDCNRRFCLDYELPICKGAREEDVFTTCFQRDSRKDEAVVFIFIFATAGLLLWAGVKPWADKWIESSRERRSYLPIPGQGDT